MVRNDQYRDEFGRCWNVGLFLMDRTLTVMLDMLRPLNLNCSYAFLELLKSNLFLASQESHEDDIQ